MADYRKLPSFRFGDWTVYIEAVGEYYHSPGVLALVGRGKDGEQIMTLTVNLSGSAEPVKGATWLKTWSENRGLVEALEAAELGVPTGRTHQVSDYVEAEEFAFTTDVWKKLADSVLGGASNG